MITIYRCIGVSETCEPWAVFSQRPRTGVMCPTCGCNQTTIVDVVPGMVHNLPENKAHSAWLALVDDLTRQYYAALLYIVGTQNHTPGVGYATMTVDLIRSREGLPPLADVLTDATAQAATDAVMVACGFIGRVASTR